MRAEAIVRIYFSTLTSLGLASATDRRNRTQIEPLTSTTMIHTRCLRAIGLLLIFGIALLGLSVQTVSATNVDTAGFKLSISENLAVLKNDNAKNRMMAAWTTPTQLAMERNQPFLLLENTSDMEMTSFSMTIGRTSSNFDWAKVVSKSSGVQATLVTPDSKEGGADGDVITFDLNGFTPGKKLFFQIDIDSDKSSANPFGEFSDYRRVLFSLNKNTSLSKNSQLSATFLDTATNSEIAIDPFPWRAPGDLPGTFEQPQDNQRTVFGLAFQSHYMNDFVRSYETGNVTTVPEPGSLVLAGLGVVGLLFGSRRVRAKTAL